MQETKKTLFHRINACVERQHKSPIVYVELGGAVQKNKLELIAG